MNDSSAERRDSESASAASPDTATASPGALLRQARERAGLGVEDLAGQLKLARNTLEALERDDFAALSEPVYVRGYYRKIAKLLEISDQDLVAAFDARVKPSKTAPALQRIPLAGGVAAGASRRAYGPGLGLGLAALAAIGLLLVFARIDPPRRLSETGVAPAAPAAQQPAVSEPAAEPQPAGAVAEPAAPPPAGVPNQLVLEFSEASFVRVEDSRNKTLAIGLVRGGERQVLNGQPPYTVFLGNAQNVKLSFGGAPVDFSSHINAQNDTARFTVP